MSCDGLIIGLPFEGAKTLFVLSIKVCDFDLCFDRQRQVNCHLVSVEVSVEALTNQRMQVNRVALHQALAQMPEFPCGAAWEHDSTTLGDW